ncbi:MAG: hypothetical protein ACRDH9_00005, partial [Actinomycetota bacterium]
MRSAVMLISAAWMFLIMFGGPALATHKDGHQKPPACEKAQGQAPVKNKHCYPPAASAPTSQG